MYRICRSFSFSASHQLVGLPEGHPCGRLHGHNWHLEFVLHSEQLDRVGFVRDFGELEEVGWAIREDLDHRHLNEVLPINPTSENLAHWLWTRWKPLFPDLARIRVSETAGSWAEYGE